MSWYDMLKTRIWDNPFQPSDPAVRAAMDGTLPPLDFTRPIDPRLNAMFGPRPERSGTDDAAGHLAYLLDQMEERAKRREWTSPEQVQVVRDAVTDWYAEHEAADHTDHVHVSPNVVAEALERQASERAASLDDLLAALDVDLLPWQRDCLGRWVEHKLTFRMR